ncbi:RICIN domain-containing protein, partial [Microbispora sp. ATCC PTA-5024]|uniref:RICIN domain-containing protein n=1 Tax=Microbispora sp. ATCC PTA-5024 TaxID=316330 RepID=UPI0018DE9B08
MLTAPPALAGTAYYMKNYNSRLCLTIAGGGKAANAPAVQYYCDSHPSRLWTFLYQSGGFYKIRNKNSGLCL